MTVYRWGIDRIIQANGQEAAEDWAGHLTTTAIDIIRTVRLALENDNAGFCSDEYRIASAANTLELAEALLALADEGTESMARQLNRGTWKPEDAA